MSLHRSLRRKDALVRRRNVLTRTERIDRLQKEEKWEDGRSVLGLPKVKLVVATSPAKAAKEAAKAEEAEAAEGAETTAAEPTAKTEKKEGSRPAGDRRR